MSTYANIMAALKTRLETILSSGMGLPHYTTDLGAHVMIARSSPFEADDLPAASIDNEEARPVQEWASETSLVDYELPVTVSIVATTQAQARSCIDDVIVCVGQDRTLGGNAIDVTPRIHRLLVDQGQKETNFVAAEVDLLVTYRVSKYST